MSTAEILAIIALAGHVVNAFVAYAHSRNNKKHHEHMLTADQVNRKKTGSP